LAHSDFSGGEATVEAKLKALGFQIVHADIKTESVADTEVQAWAEITSLEHGHGGAGWGLGRYLWSPTSAKDGSNRYSIMKEPMTGDQVFHLVSGVSGEPAKRRFLYGVSQVRQPAATTGEKPPLGGAWTWPDRYFRIELSDFREFDPKLPMDEVEEGLAEQILSELVVRPKYYPYSPHGEGFRGAQGIYLTKLTTGLTKAFRELAGIEWPLKNGASKPDELPSQARKAALEFAEGERSQRESIFFAGIPGYGRRRSSAMGFDALRAAWISENGTDRSQPDILRFIISTPLRSDETSLRESP
jgi:hypothetical protein